MKSFWDSLPKPFFVMAPMADVTDPAFRALVARYGKPGVTWTEFVSADGLYHTREIKKMPDNENPLMRDLQFTEAERPIVAQFFSSKPEMIAYTAKLAHELGFDGFDINMGCPDTSIERQGAGAAMIKTPELAVEVIKAAQAASPLPVSVKTRIGYSKNELEEWLPTLLAANPAAITLHLRTRKEMSNVPAHWELMKRAVEIRDAINPQVLMLGNGDIKDLDDAKAKVAESGADGAMLGRAIFGNPWVFNPAALENPDAKQSQLKKLEALVELAHAFQALRPQKSFHILKKHIKAFVTGFDGAAELRAKLMEAENASELEVAIRSNTL
jgi:nifR3 family TIM-barrel protein